MTRVMWGPSFANEDQPEHTRCTWRGLVLSSIQHVKKVLVV
jgi:hypothetical protein